MELPKKVKIELFIVLIFLNLILRYSVTHHEIFNDSFEMHILANSLSDFGEARWWVHPLSIIGMYPNSYTSAISFILSGISQCTGLEVELAIFLYGLIFGLFTVFIGYILAGIIHDNDLYKFLVAFGYSVSPGILAYTTWTAHARSPFIILLPLFLYTLLKSRKDHLRFGLITAILALLLFATHHLAFYLIPIFAAYFLVTLVYKLKEHIGLIKKVIKKSENVMPLFIIFAFCLMFAYSFITHKFMVGASRWDYLTYKEYLRYIGIFVFLAIGGFVYLVFKPNKRYVEWSLLAMLMLLTVFIQQQMYMKWFMIIFAILLAGMAFMNLNKLREDEKKKKYATLAIIIFLMLSVSFSGYFQFLHSYSNPGSAMQRYMEDSEYSTGLWIKENLDGKGISNDRWIGWRISATSGFPFLTGSATDDQAYGFVDVSEFELVKLSWTSEEFWMNMPYKRVKGTVADGYWQHVMANKYDSIRASNLLSRFNLTHVIENTRTRGKWCSHHGHSPSEFMHSIYNKKVCVYDSGKTSIWVL